MFYYVNKDSFAHFLFIFFQIILVREIGNEDYFMGKKGLKEGRVPKAFLEVLN